MLSPGRGSAESAKRKDLRIRLVAERLTGEPLDDSDYISRWMQRGIDFEPQARAAYESQTGTLVAECGFIAHNQMPIGCSPDGLIDGGGLELKVPKLSTHVAYLDESRLPPEYRPQLLHSLWVTGADFWDFASYAPEMPNNLRLFCIRVQRDEAAIQEYATKALAFLAEVETKLAALQTVSNLKARLEAAVGA